MQEFVRILKTTELWRTYDNDDVIMNKGSDEQVYSLGLREAGVFIHDTHIIN